MLPGSVLLVFGVRARRGRSVGGRGAGRASMNWLFEYMLVGGQKGQMAVMMAKKAGMRVNRGRDYLVLLTWDR